MQLSSHDQSRAAFHLGLNVGAQIPAGDLARFYEACRRIPDSHWYDQIVEQLARCDRAFYASEVLKSVADTGAIAPSQLQMISGDTNRSVAVADPMRAERIYWELYLCEVDKLAQSLYVSNYRRPEVMRQAFVRSGNSFIQALPGPADTSVGTRIAEASGLAFA